LCGRKVSQCNRITACRGFKLLVNVKLGPHMVVDYTMKEKIKAVMAKRYNIGLKALDFSHIFKYTDLTDTAMSLSRPSLMLVALDIMEENLPDLAVLDICDNKLYSLDNLSEVPIKLHQLKVLNIVRNRIQDFHVLDCFEGLHLEQLVLFGTPLCMKYHDCNAYVSDVRKRLPQLLKLDDVYICPLIMADLNEDGLDLSRLSNCDISEDSEVA
jgi:nuclear RNA export factor